MKRVALLSALLAAAVLLAACGPSAAQTVSNTGSGGSSNNQASSGATEVDVTLGDYTIESSLATFKVGVPYRFVIINNGNHQHNFNIAAPVEKTGSVNASLNSALLTVPEDKLPIGGGTTVLYTFPASAAGQQLEFSCLIRLHYEKGMRLAITVTN
jgi:uncharacterized cupredoxin-like copper-binding protein